MTEVLRHSAAVAEKLKAYNDEREQEKIEAFVADMEKVGLKRVHSRIPPQLAHDRNYDPYSDLE